MPCHLISKLNTGEGGEKKKRKETKKEKMSEQKLPQTRMQRKKKNYLFNYFRFSI